ncbi:MAG TPA: hypothetical protein VF710_26225 [Longimicrobium sp.]|jgi:hypothetical protein
MSIRTGLLALCVALPFAACKSPSDSAPPEVLLTENFNSENGGLYKLNYTGFAQWTVVAGTVDLVGTYPYDDFLPKTQGLYLDLDGTTRAAGTLRSRTAFDLKPGNYRLEFKMSGTPRSNQLPNTVIVTVGTVYTETITLSSFAPLNTYVRTFRVKSRESGNLTFQHLGGDDYGNFIDDIRLERL